MSTDRNSERKAGAFAFGKFVLDRQARRLLGSGKPIHLPPKALELLCLLVERRPEAVSKDEIHERLWPDTFVSGTNLTDLVFELRTALEESARDPRYIRTVHRFGYAFEGDPVAAPGQCRLVRGPMQFVLHEGENVLGRSRAATFRIDSPGVSRRHAIIRVSGTTATIEDCGSRHGTRVGGHRISGPQVLQDGDRISLEAESFVFRAGEDEAATI
ncbi:MAG TPA: FHA domain-containing protein [Vicinamibacteria bacterium]|jgi:DNA-binding winged helix-turn-helix (wHTH) protein